MIKNRFVTKLLGVTLMASLLTGCATTSTGATSSTPTTEVIATTEPEVVESGNTLVVYFSAQGHTVQIAEAIAEELDADLFEIIPVNEYSTEDLDWTQPNSRVSQEHDDESLRNVELVSTSVENWESYDTVYIGYPIWWGGAAWPINNFVIENDFTGKTVIPFATSQSSGLGNSAKNLEELTGTGTWLEGRRFQSNENIENAKTWAASLAE